MQYSKPMIELVYEIRRYVPSEMKPGVKLANPQLFVELSEHYRSNAKTVTKALIKELFTLAGEGWLNYLTVPPEPIQRHNSKAYRGVVSLTPAEVGNDTSSPEHAMGQEDTNNTIRKKRIYRGQVIA